jgi:thymidylate kinase
MDQPARQHRGGHSVNSADRCLKQVDRFRYDGAGKTTLAKGLLSAFDARGLRAIEVGRSGANSNTAVSTLTDLIKSSDGGEAALDPVADVFVRLARPHELIKLILEADADIIVLDRFVAYDLSRVDSQLRDSYVGLFEAALARFQLDMTIFLNAPFELL